MTYPGWWIQYANQNQHVSEQLEILIGDSSLGETKFWVRNLKIKALDDIPISIGIAGTGASWKYLPYWVSGCTKCKQKKKTKTNNLSLTQRPLYYCLKN